MTGGMALGVVPGLAYKEQSLKLEAGDSLFLYTDGISEAMNLRNEQYGDIRLVEACSSVKNQSQIHDRRYIRIRPIFRERRYAER